MEGGNNGKYDGEPTKLEFKWAEEELNLRRGFEKGWVVFLLADH